MTVFGVVLSMGALSFASVPLYNLFCRVTGFGGTTQTAVQAPDPHQILDRNITVRFNADTSRNLLWDFNPQQRSIDVKIGQEKLVAYSAKNTGSQPSGGTAIYNVTPDKAGRYFHKVQCFCFDEQILNPGQKVNMPVSFFIDPKLHDDPALDDLTSITLSYTFFPAESDELDKALETFYDQ